MLIYTEGNQYIRDTDTGSNTKVHPGGSAYEELMRRVRDEGLVIEPYVPPPAPLPKDVRAGRYKNEADPLLLAFLGYEREIAWETDPQKKAALEVKRSKADLDYLAAKAKIRSEVPD